MDSHIGRQVLQVMKKFENQVQQIELISGAEETHGSVRIRSIRAAEALKVRGVKKGDIIILSAVNHNDVCIPYLASFYIGAIPLALTVGMKPIEIEHILNYAKPRMIFSDPEAMPNIREALLNMNIEAEIVNFGDEKLNGCLHFSEFTKSTGTEDSFECVDLDPKTSIATLACSSGTTGLPKLVALSHESLFYLSKSLFTVIFGNATEYEISKMVYLSFSPLYWLSGVVAILFSCELGLTRVQSVKSYSPEDFYAALCKYNVNITVVGPLLMSKASKYARRNNINYPTLETVLLGGSFTSQDIIEEFEKYIPNGNIIQGYGCTEIMFISCSRGAKKGSCGKLISSASAKIVNNETEEEVGPNELGELRVKTPHIFLGYYNNPEATKAAFDENGWYKTGDMMRIDEDGNFFFVERIKQLLKFRHYQIASVELESFICRIPGVDSVGVVGIPHVEDGELPLAFVQLIPGAKVTAKEIKDYVKEKLSDYKQLRGGVVFVDSLPLTYSGKIDKKALNIMKINCKPE